MIPTATGLLSNHHDFVPEDDFTASVDVPAGSPFTTRMPVTFPEGTAEYNLGSQANRHEHDFGTETSAFDIPGKVLRQAEQDVKRFDASARAHANLGLALLNVGRFLESKREFEVALSLDPSHYLAVASLARLKLQQGDLDEAANSYQKLRQLNPSDPDPLMNLAHIASLRGALDESARLWERAITSLPNEPLPRLNLAIVLLRHKQYREAIAQLKIAIGMEPRLTVAHQALGVAYALMTNREKAIRSFKAALVLSPGMPDAVHGLAEMLVAKKLYTEASTVLAQHRDAVPADYKARELLAWTFIQQGKHREAKAELFAAFQAVQRLGKDEALHRRRLTNNLGVCFWLEGDRTEASRMFDLSIQTGVHEDPIPFHNLARVYLENQRLAQAREVIDQCLRLFPGNDDTQLLLAITLRVQGRYDESIEELRRLLQTGRAPADAYNLLSALLVDYAQDPSAAIGIQQVAHERFPHDAIAVNNLAYAHLMQGDTASARRVLDAFVDTPTGVSEIVLSATRGLLALLEGDIKQGRDGYQHAEHIARHQGRFDWIPSIKQKMYLELARAYVKVGNRGAALSSVRAGLGADLSRGGDPLYRRALERLEVALRRHPK